MWEETARRVAEKLKDVPGVMAVALGGSHCTGTATDHSDIDIGVYFEGCLGAQEMDKALAELDDDRREGLLNRPGEWGKWINGGAWLTVDGHKVDILLRDTGRVADVIDDCQQGRVTVDFQAGHPFGFVNAIYMGEVKYCLPLADPKNVLRALKERAEPVSDVYRKAASAWFLWEAGFSMMTGRSAVKKRDIVYASGCMFKAILCMAQAVFAANGEILLNEKGAVGRMKAVPFCPPGFARDAEAALQGLDRDNLGKGFDTLEEMHMEVAKYLGARGEA